MSQGFVLAVDNGSQSTKVSVVDAAGVVHASARVPLRPYAFPTPGHVVHPDDDLWDSIVAACRAALSDFGRPEEIVAVGLCTIRYCRALLDDSGGLVEPVLSWMDHRVGLPHDPSDTRVRWVTTSSGYVTHRLTGRFVDTRANYRGLWPIDEETGEWSSEAREFERTGMPRRLLFDLVSPGEVLGPVTAAAAAATGIPAGVPVVATANDKAVEALGCGLRSPDTVLLSLGTYIAAMTTGASANPGNGAPWVNFGAVPGEYLYESGGIRRGMWTVSWFRDLVSGGLLLDGTDALAVLDTEAAAVAPGCGGLVALLDWLASPDAPHRRGALLGFDGTQGRGAVHRAILEGIALTMVEHVEAMERGLGRRQSALVVSGGGAGSDVMMQIVADVFGRPASRPLLTDAAGLGAAICAAVGVGLHPDVDAAVAAMVRPGGSFTPDPAAAEAYREVRRIRRGIATHTDPLFAWMTGGVAGPPVLAASES